ncbi:MAG: peptidase M16, partial [Spirochaetales bacterium]
AGKNVKPYLFFRLKMLKTTLTEAFSLIRRLLTETDFADTKRLKDLLLEMRNDYKSSVLPRGSFLAALRAGSRISLPMFYDERWKGISQLLHLEGMTSSVEAGDLDALRIILNTIKNAVLDASLLSVNITVEPENRLPVLREVENLVSSLPDTGTGTAGAGSPFFEDRRLPDGPFEPLIIPGGVGFAGCAFPGAFLGTDDHGLETVLAHLLATGFLWEQVRMKGGAYGASAYANGTEGVFSFSSYRDPDITETIRIFRESLEFAASGKIEDDTVVKAIIGSVGKDIKPLAPGIKGFLGYRRNLYGISDGLRQQRRDAMLSCTAVGIAQSAGRLLEQLASGSYTLLGGAEAIQKAVDRLNIKRAPLKLPV